MYGWRRQIGFIVPSNNTVFEPEIYHIAPEGVSVHFTKILFKKARDGTNQDQGDGVEVFHRAGVDVIVYACMATSLVDASQWERETTEYTGIPAVTAANATKEALRAVGAHSVALVCHYAPDRHDLLKDSFKADGFQVVSIETANVPEPKLVNRISTDEVYRLARKANRPEADAVCLLATDLRSFPILQQLEDDLGKPVISTNQAILWKSLQSAGVRPDIQGYGKLLSGTILAPAAVT